MAGEAAQTRIDVLLNTSQALGSIRKLQAGLSQFHQSFVQGSAASAAAQQGQIKALQLAINKTGELIAVQKTVRSSTEAFTTALERNKLSLRQYARFSAAAMLEGGIGTRMAASKRLAFTRNFFAQERGILQKAIKDRVRILQSQWIRMTPIGSDPGMGLQTMSAPSLAANKKSLNDLISRQQMSAQRMQIFNKLVKDGSTKLLNFGKNTQWAGRQLMVGFTIPLVMLGAAAAKSFRELEKQAVRFRKVYGQMFSSEAETEQALKSIQTLAKEFTKYGIAVEKTMQMAADAAQAGFMGKALENQVTESTRLSILGDIDLEKSLETTIALQNAFKISTEDLAGSINFLNAVENQTVLSLTDISEAVPRVGPIITELGGDVKDLAFFLTAMKEGGVSAAQGANALKAGLGRLINPTKAASEFMADFGINLRGIVEANEGDLRGIVVGFAKAIESLSPTQRAQSIEKVFGKFQFARTLALINNITDAGSQASRVFDLMAYSAEEFAILAERELAQVENSVGVNFQQTLEELKVQIAPLGEAFLKFLNPIIKFAGKASTLFSKLEEGNQKLILGVGLIAPVAVMTFGLLGNFLAQGINLFRALFFGVARARQGFQGLGSGVNYLAQQELLAQSQTEALNGAQEKLNNTQYRLNNTFSASGKAVNAYTAALTRAAAAAQRLATLNPGLLVGGRGSVKKLATGTTKVQYYSKGTDTVPAMLTPGEAVIPAKSAQDPANKPAIAAMIAGQRVQQFSEGSPGVSQADRIRQARLAQMSATDRAIEKSNERKLKRMIKQERFDKNTSAREAAARKREIKIKEKANIEREKLAASQKADAAKAKKLDRQERVRSATGKMSGGLFMGAMAASMMGAPTGVSTAMMGAGAVAMLGPALLNPYVAAATALVTVTGGLYLLNREAKKAAERQSQYVDSISATTEKMKQLGVLTEKIGASEIMSRRRQGATAERYTTGFERGKSQFGAQFMESKVGAEIFESFKKDMVNGTSQAAQQMALQLSSYISDGIMTVEQANSVASQIGINLNNSTLITQISGRLMDLVGPNGDDLLKNPLQVRVKIIEESQNILDTFLPSLKTQIDKLKEQTTAGFSEDPLVGIGQFAALKLLPIFTETGIEKNAATIGAMGVQNLEIAIAQQDALYRQYEIQIDSLKKQKDAETNAEKRLQLEKQIAILEGKKDEDLTSIRKKTTDILAQNQKAFDLANKDRYASRAMIRGAEAQVMEKYKDQPDLAKEALGQVKQVATRDLQFKLTSIMGAGVIAPSAMTNLLNLWEGATDPKVADGLSTTLTVAFEKQDSGQVTAMLNSLGVVENKSVARQIILEAIESDPEQFDKIASTITLLEQMAGKEVNFSAFFDDQMAYQKLLNLTNQLEAVEQMPTPITKEAIANIDVDGNSETKDMGELLKIWDQWENLDDETKKTVIQTYLTVYRTITEGDVDAEIERQAAGNKYVAELNKNSELARKNAFEKLAAERTMNKVQQDLATKQAAALKKEKDNNKSRNTMFDDLLKKLKLYNQFTVNAIGGTKELMRLFEKGKNIKGFMGTQQKLRNLGAGDPLLGFVGSLGAEELQKMYPKLVRVTKKGKTVLSEFAKAINQALPTAASGEFVEKQRLIVSNTQNQIKAMTKLQNKGLTAVEIMAILEDTAVAAGIAAGDIKGENLKKLIKNTKEGTGAVRELEKALKAVKFAADEASEGEAEKLDEAFEFEFLKIEKAARDAFIAVNNLSPEKMEINVDILKEELADIEKEIQSINDEVALFNRALELISRQEEEITEAYDAKIESINKQISALDKIKELNNEIAQQQKQQISLADALTSGDISAAAKLASDMRASSTQSAFDRMSSSLQARAEDLEIKKQKEIDSILGQVNNKLYTRKELEKLILKLNDDIYNIELTRLKPKQKEIDDLESILRKYETMISRSQSLTTISGLTKKEWEFIKDYVDAANKNADELIMDIDAIAASSLSAKESWAAIVNSMIEAGKLKTGVTIDDSKIIKTEEKDSGIVSVQPISVGVGPSPSAVSPSGKEISSSELFGRLTPEEESKYFGSTTPQTSDLTAFERMLFGFANGGMVSKKYMANGGLNRGTDTIPAMLTPGEFVVRKYAVQDFGLNNLNKINDGSYSGGSVYNYNLSVNVKSGANPNDIARVVMTQIKQIDSQRIRGQA